MKLKLTAPDYTFPLNGREKRIFKNQQITVEGSVATELLKTGLFEEIIETIQQDENADCIQRFLEKLPNKILIKRSVGGIGDILYHRMIFEDLYKILAKRKIEVDFAIARHFIQLVEDHPYIHEVLPIDEVDESKYLKVWDTTHVAGNYEYNHLPNISLHRSDIWAEKAIGFKLKNHNGHIQFSEQEKAQQNSFRDEFIGDSLALGLTIRTAARVKDWEAHKWYKLVKQIKQRYDNVKVFVFGAQQVKIQGARFVETDTFRKWMYLIDAMDFIITPATGLFCLANLLKKPTVAIFGNEDLRIFGKHFPECIPIQRRADEHGENWARCPCWRYDHCYKGIVNGIPACLRDISVSEVLEAFKRIYKDFKNGRKKIVSRTFKASQMAKETS